MSDVRFVGTEAGHDVYLGTVDGQKVLYVQPALHEDDPLREVVAARRAVNFGEPCPYCGERLIRPSRHEQLLAILEGRVIQDNFAAAWDIVLVVQLSMMRADGHAGSLRVEIQISPVGNDR